MTLLKNNVDLDLLVECYKAMSDKTRLKMLALLKEEELCVCEFVEIFEMTQPAISQHLRKLKNAKLVKERREGQWVFYSLDGSVFPFFESNLLMLPEMKHEIDKLKVAGLKVCCK